MALDPKAIRGSAADAAIQFGTEAKAMHGETRTTEAPSGPAVGERLAAPMRPRVPMPRPQQPSQPASPSTTPRYKGMTPPARIRSGSEWISRIPGRLWFAASVLSAPIKAVFWVLDAIVAASVVGVLGTIVAVWNHTIPDEVVAKFIGEIGSHGLAILGKSGVL